MSAIIDPAVVVDVDLIEDLEAPAAGTDPSAAPETDIPAADGDQPANESVQEYLMRNLLAEDPPVADAPEADDPADELPEDPVKDPAEEPPAEDPKTQEPSKVDDPEKPDSKTSTNAPIKILSREEIEKQFDRAPKAIRDVAAAYGEAATDLQKRLDAFGGEHFAEPMQMIAEGLLKDNNISVIHGVLQAQGVDGFTGLMKDFMRVALIDAHNDDSKEEGATYFRNACETAITELFQARFGENASPALVTKLLKAQADGLIDTTDIDTYYEEGGDGTPNPVVKEQKDKIADLERQLLESKATETDTSLSNEKRFAEQWSTDIFKDTNLEDLYFKHSVLKPVKGDSQELTAGKQQIKSLVLEAAREFQKNDPVYKKLQAAAYRGNGETAKYKTEKSALVENTIFHAKKVAAPLEALIGQIYALGRNANIPAIPTAKKAAAAGNPSAQPQFELKEPTQTTAAPKKEWTPESWKAHMVSELAKG